MEEFLERAEHSYMYCGLAAGESQYHQRHKFLGGPHVALRELLPVLPGYHPNYPHLLGNRQNLNNSMPNVNPDSGGGLQ